MAHTLTPAADGLPPPTQPNPQPWLTADPLLDDRQSAQFLTLTNPRTLAAWRLRKQGPQYVKIGKNVRYRLSALLAYLDSCTVTPPARVPAVTPPLPADPATVAAEGLIRDHGAPAVATAYGRPDLAPADLLRALAENPRALDRTKLRLAQMPP